MAKIFRLEQNVPDIYIKESRDFQMLCNLFDIMHSSTKFDIDTMTNILDPTLCNESVLPFLQSKLGFFTKRDFTTQELRHVLSSFKRLVKDKGSRIGIREAIEIYLKLICSLGSYRITVTNSKQLEQTANLQSFNQTSVEKVYNKLDNVYLIEIQLETSIKNLTVLREMLKYVLPTGYDVHFGFYSAKEVNTRLKLSHDEFHIVIIREDYNNSVRCDINPQNELQTSLKGHVSTTHAIEKGKTYEDFS